VHVRRRRFGAIAVGALALALVALPSAAPAEQVTLGPALGPLAPSMFTPGCPMTGSSCTEIQALLGGNPPPTSPVNGVITSWTVRAPFAGQGYRLRVLRGSFSFGGKFTALRSSDPSPALAAGSTTQLAAALPIAIGDQIGLRVPAGGTVPAFAAPAGGTSTILSTQFPVDPEDGGTGQTNGSAGGLVLGVDATISFCRIPAVTGRTLKKAKALLAAETCTGKKVKKGRTHSRKKSKKVNHQVPAAGTTVAPGTPVQLNVKKLKH
jgi:hypothetical protein